MDTKPVERKYALQKVASGDWVLLGNDGRTLWRFAKYEDGPSHGLDSMTRDRMFWGVWKWPQPVPSDDAFARVEFETLANWDLYEQMCKDREAAIQSALRSELPRTKMARKGTLQDAIRSMVAQT
jgi:hypothetical protein